MIISVNSRNPCLIKISWNKHEDKEITASNKVEERIILIRSQKVLIDRDLAALYGVETKNLNRQVKRNSKRFPPEFMFRLTSKEKNELVAKWHRFNSLKHSSVLPYAFTEHGAVMLASVLNSDKAVEASIYIVRAFVRLREILLTHKELAQKNEGAGTKDRNT
ncbi:MAG: hypothetical protein FD143_2735 [Ignavibacteria bacterium]|nr:MAG: hypothetical protein FD143_2735 [Ignavibacteria bacterium]KAF0157623.1 MAG: hypothetical protein FD188_2722 [Ignavibacteria bacterium]